MDSGEISYPRTAGISRVAWQRGPNVYLSVVSAGVVVEYRNWRFIKLIYRKRRAEDAALLRKAFDNLHRKAYLKHLAKQHREELLAAGLTEPQIGMMERGGRPSEYSVHHILPLDDGGDNEVANLVLIRESLEHRAITAFQNSVTTGMKEGEERSLDFPVPDQTFVVYPPSTGASTTLPLWKRSR